MLVETLEKTATSEAVYPFIDVQNLLLIGVRKAARRERGPAWRMGAADRLA